MITVVTWLWRTAGYRSKFTAQHVNVMRSMVERNYAYPFRFCCVTDETEGFDPRVTVIPAFNDFANVPAPQGTGNPSCYRRLRAFAPDIARWFGPRFVSIDLDAVIVRDVSDLWHRPENFVGWRDPIYRNQLNGSMFLLEAGTRDDVFKSFHPIYSPARAKQAGYQGSDQAWMSYCMPTDARWERSDGVLSYRMDIVRAKSDVLPDDARIVFFHGDVDPWSTQALELPWVREHYR